LTGGTVDRLPELSVVIPTVGRSTLSRTLDSLAGQDAPLDRFEVLIVADAAWPAARDVEASIGALPYRARVLTAPAPGAAAARNAGLSFARALVLFLDDDVLPGPRLVSQHLEWHRRCPATQVGVLGRIRWARELRVTPFMRWLEHGIQFDYSRIQGIEAGWGRFYTANVSVKRELLARVGGFDQRRLPFGYEDLDLAYRMSRIGFRLLYNRRAVAEHLHPMDLEFWRARVRRIAIAERQFTRLHPELDPYFHRLFSDAAAQPPGRGRGTRLAALVPRRTPWIGPRVWASADLGFRQALAPDFLDAWSGPLPEQEGRPELSEFDLTPSSPSNLPEG
jgi:GT2 family glycosyltransferase